MKNRSKKTMRSEVMSAYQSYPPEFREKLLTLRTLIFDTAEKIPAVGPLRETLKWGEPSYLTEKSGSGSTIRLAWKRKLPEYYSIFFKCTANLVEAFKEKFPKQFRFGGTRSIDFLLSDPIQEDELRKCIALALTYHLNKGMERDQRWAFIEKQLTCRYPNA